VQEKLEAAASKRSAKRENRKAAKAAKTAASASKQAGGASASTRRVSVRQVLRRLTGEARAVAQIA
jgi:hypothetical protein